MINIIAACGCHTGKVRLNNEDNFYFNGSILPSQNNGTAEILSVQQLNSACFAVFDGMGGEKYGEEAAYIAAKTLDELINRHRLADVCDTANNRINALSLKYGERAGSTAAIVYFKDNRIWLCNIGDSRIYRLRGGIFTQLSIDHVDKRHSVLTQHLGIFPHEMIIEPHFADEVVAQGDKYLLCTDGLTNMLSSEDITECLTSQSCVQKAVAILINQALERGGRDNITVIVCEIL